MPVLQNRRSRRRRHLPKSSSRVSKWLAGCHSMWGDDGRLQEPGAVFSLQQLALAPHAPAIARDRAVLLHDPVAWHDEGELVGRAGFADFTRLPRNAEAGRDLAVSSGRARRDLAQGVPDAAFEVRPLQVERESSVIFRMVYQG